MNIEGHKRQLRKNARLRGLEYETAKGKKVMKKELKPYEHRCRYKCHEISEAARQILFTKFYQIKSYDLQTNFIASCISKIAPKRKIAQAVSNKQFTTIIKLMGLRVCKPFFLKTLDITTRRFLTVCNKKTGEGFTETDQRGRHSPTNKISHLMRNDVITHIKMFPQYRSHYSQVDNPCTRYLPENLNISKMYSLYSEWCTEKNTAKVKESYYRHIFATEFNLKFHRPHSDTCHTCDKLNNMINNSPDEEVKTRSKVELTIHQKKVESVKQSKVDDINYGKENPDQVRVICFDLQKTLPTPLLTTNKVYYLRQLWTYNFCVYDLISGKSHMYIWNETTASRGSQEIGSCLLKVS